MTEERKSYFGQIRLGFLQDDIGFQIHQARRAVRISLRDHRGPGNIPPNGTISTIILIGLNPGISQLDIAEALFLDGSKVAMLVKQLEADGQVEKCRSAEDGRRFELYLTPNGKNMLSSIESTHKERIGKVDNRLSLDEREQLVKLLLKVQQSIS